MLITTIKKFSFSIFIRLYLEVSKYFWHFNSYVTMDTP